ncbi:MAG: PH domain-containing protein [Acidobacteria bacterium]|nr:PH domain-containing protein [Acidobacteriota bacterium]
MSEEREDQAAPVVEIRPTLRFIRLGYAVAGGLLLAALVWWATDKGNPYPVIVALLVLLWPASRHLKRQRVRCRLEGGHLRYQAGLVSTTVKTIPINKIQDVTVRRSLTQRLWGVGTLRIESAGQSSALEIANVDDPEQAAKKILEAQSASSAQP